MRRSLIIAVAAELLTTVSMVLSFKLAIGLWGDDGFGEWVLARRLLSFLMPLVLFGLDVAIPRYIAAEGDEDRSSAAGRIVSAAASLVGLSVAVAIAVLLAGRAEIARVLYGNPRFEHFAVPVSVLMIGLAIHLLVYAYLRGTLRVRSASLLHVVTYGALPLAVLAWSPQSPSDALLSLGLLISAIVVPAAVFLVWLDALTLVPRRGDARRLVRYGFPRMHAAFGLLLLAWLPTAIAAAVSGLAEAGFVTFGLSLIGMAGSAAAPIGLAFLPIASRLFAEGRSASLRRPIRQLQWLVALASLSLVAVVLPFADAISDLFFDDEEGHAARILEICALGAGPNFYFCCMRNLIDAKTERGVNTVTVSIALAVFVAIGALGISFKFDAAQVVSFAYVASILVLAWRTHRISTAMLSSSSAA